MGKKTKEKLKEKIDSVLAGMEEEFSLRKLKVSENNRVNSIKVFVEKPGGITVDDCAKISKKLSVHFKILDYINKNFKLEVSSPGIENEEEK